MSEYKKVHKIKTYSSIFDAEKDMNSMATYDWEVLSVSVLSMSIIVVTYRTDRL